MLGRQHHERGAPQRVRPRREDLDGLAVLRMEGHLGTRAAADPVGLHDLDRIGPLDVLEIGQQFVRVVGDAELPLFQFLLDDRGAAPFAVIVLAPYLFAGQGGVAFRAPVHGRLLAVGEIGLQQAQEEPLRPLVVPGLAGDRLAVPGPHRAHLPQLAAHVVDVVVGPNPRVDAVGDGRVLGRQAERVEPNREEDVGPLHAPITGRGVAGGHGVPMPHVQVPGRVGEHGQGVPLGPVRILHGPIQAQPFPFLLPLGLDGRRVVAGNFGRHGIRP